MFNGKPQLVVARAVARPVVVQSVGLLPAQHAQHVATPARAWTLAVALRLHSAFAGAPRDRFELRQRLAARSMLL